jgi:V-ATPase subunit C
VEISPSQTAPLKIGNTQSVENFLKQFQWDKARYPHTGKPLREIVKSIQDMAAKDDDDLKKLSSSFQEKQVGLGTLQRKTQVNLQTSDLEDFLTPAQVSKSNLLPLSDSADSTLLTVLVVMPRALEAGTVAFVCERDTKWNGTKHRCPLLFCIFLSNGLSSY